ncbi:antibiotic biosynthesis monooxygenase family protein [Massilia genomosp. 1]|uniref:Antibiotic biosynthesis monooxygenase n=1 Tax=Massilia genomosp. 1 TaxID=2609280 RepID=A0ABX0N3X6_9BURK|nr:antibiotic biosynthesis monooxygenase family protein [Massilia genomosp. 1]NHZ66229.1 antibiotic biosynthesis monooxygenase [Massilia genomosp. 1]
MFREVAELKVAAGTEQQFEAGVQQAVALFKRAKGCHGMRMERSVEEPGSYMLFVEWETIEDHMVHFRESEDFQEWRRLVGGFFSAPPRVFHTTSAVEGF